MNEGAMEDVDRGDTGPDEVAVLDEGGPGASRPEAAPVDSGAAEPFDETVTSDTLEEDASLIRWLRKRLPGQSGNAVRRLIESGKIWVDGVVATEPSRLLRVGHQVSLRWNAPRADRSHLVGPKIYYLDSYLVVAEKPIGILTIPFEEDHDTLMDRVRRVIPKLEKRGSVPPLRAVHRLDKEASGLVVFTRGVKVQRDLQEQFASHTVERAYLALVQGDVSFEQQRTMQSTLVSDRGDGLKGSARASNAVGKEAVTHFEVLERFGIATLLRCQLETGRTHQIRIHAAELGHPIIGEPVYVRDYRGPLLQSPRLMLHATSLGFVHPGSGEGLRFESPAPEVFASYLLGLRRGRQPGRAKPRRR